MNVPLSPARTAGSPQLPAARLPDLPGRAQPLSAAPGRPAGAGSPRLRAAGQGTAASPARSGPGTAGAPRPRRPVGAVRPSPRLPLPGGTERHREPPYLAAPGEPRRRRPAGAAPGARRAPGPPRPPVPPCRRCRRCGAERGGAEWRERGGAGAGGEEETKSRQSRTRIPGTPAGAPPRRASRSPAKRRAAGRGGAGRGAPGPAGGRARSCGRPPGTSALPAPARLPLTEIECGRRRFTGRSGSLGPPRWEPERPRQRRIVRPGRDGHREPRGQRGGRGVAEEEPLGQGFLAVGFQPPGPDGIPRAVEPPGPAPLPWPERSERSQTTWSRLSGINQPQEPAQASGAK